MSGTSFGKRDRDLAKRAKANAKRERRRAAQSSTEPTTAVAPAGQGDMATADLLRMIEEVHRLHDEGRISDDDFQIKKDELLAQLSVD